MKLWSSEQFVLLFALVCLVVVNVALGSSIAFGTTEQLQLEVRSAVNQLMVVRAPFESIAKLNDRDPIELRGTVEYVNRSNFRVLKRDLEKTEEETCAFMVAKITPQFTVGRIRFQISDDRAVLWGLETECAGVVERHEAGER